MPKSSKLAVDGSTPGRVLALVYGTSERLKWEIKYASENLVTAYTDDHEKQVTVAINASEIVVASQPAPGASLTLFQNQSKCQRLFLETFEEIHRSATPERLTAWQEEVRPIMEKTILRAEEEAKQFEELNNIMKFSTGNMYCTYGLIALNIIVFIAMAISGVDIFSPTGGDIVKWGGNFSPSTLTGGWWRLLSCVFVHIGIIHLLFNMYALYIIGAYLERMLGKTRYIVAYLCTGVLASLTSLWWHDTPVASAGASGAIFGMYGVFLALLSTNLIPKLARSQLLQSIGIFVAYNLIFGLKAGIDNAAHIGGLLSGLVIGYLYYTALRKREENHQTNYQPFIAAAVTILFTFFYLKANDQTAELTGQKEMERDAETFSRTMEHFGALEELAMEAMQKPDTISHEQYLINLRKTALIDWAESVNLFDEARRLKLFPHLKVLRENMREYSNQRLQQTLLVIKAAEEQTQQYDARIDSIDNLIVELIERVRNSGPPRTD